MQIVPMLLIPWELQPWTSISVHVVSFLIIIWIWRMKYISVFIEFITRLNIIRFISLLLFRFFLVNLTCFIAFKSKNRKCLIAVRKYIKQWFVCIFIEETWKRQQLISLLLYSQNCYLIAQGNNLSQSIPLSNS